MPARVYIILTASLILIAGKKEGERPSVSDTVVEGVEGERTSAGKVSALLIKHTISPSPGLQMAGTVVLILIVGVGAGQG